MKWESLVWLAILIASLVGIGKLSKPKGGNNGKG
jgi:hypothetical protein